MAGYPQVGYQQQPLQYMQPPAPPQQYAPPPQQYAAPPQQYAPAPQQYAAPPAAPQFGYQQQPVDEDDVTSIIRKHAKKAAQVAKRAASQYFADQQNGSQGQFDVGFQNQPAQPRRNQAPRADGRFSAEPEMMQTEQRDPVEALMDSFDRFDSGKLTELLGKYSPRSQEHEAISLLIEERAHSDDLEQVDDLGDELSDLVFCGVRWYDDVSKEWISYKIKIQCEDVQTLVDKVKSEFPNATKIKWGHVLNKGRRAESLSNKLYAIRGTAEKLAASPQVQQGGNQYYQPAPPQQDLMGMLKIVVDQGAQNQRLMMEMMKDKPKEEKTDPFDSMMKMKALLVDPQMEMMKIMHGGEKKASTLDPIELANTMMGGAVKLAGMGGSSEKGGGSDVVEGLLKKFMPYIAAIMQQVQPPQQEGGTTATGLIPGLNGQKRLPAPNGRQAQTQQPQQNQQAAQERALMQALVNRTTRIISLMLEGKLKLEQVPRYIYRNTQDKQAEGLKLIEIGLDGFAEIIRAVAGQNEMLKAYMSRPDMKIGAQWIYEEFLRLVVVVSKLIDEKDDKGIEEIISWKAKVFIETTLVGDKAAAAFKKIYGFDMPSTEKGGEDLPEEDELPSDDEEDSDKEGEDEEENQATPLIKLPVRVRKKKPSFMSANARNAIHKEGETTSAESTDQ